MQANNTEMELSRNSRHGKHRHQHQHHHHRNQYSHNREYSNYDDEVNGNNKIIKEENNLESISCMLLPLKRNAPVVDVSATLQAIDQLSMMHYSDTTSMTNTTSSNTNNDTHEKYSSEHVQYINDKSNTIKNNGEMYKEPKMNDANAIVNTNLLNNRNPVPSHPYESTNESNETDSNNSKNNKNILNNHAYCSYNNYINKENKNENEPLLLPNHEMHFGQISAPSLSHNYNYQPTISRKVNVSTPSLQVINNVDSMFANPFMCNENEMSSHMLSLSAGRRRRSCSRKRSTSPQRTFLSFCDKSQTDDLKNYNNYNNQRMSTKYYNVHPTWQGGTKSKIKDRRLRRIKAYDQHLKEMNKRKFNLEHDEELTLPQELEQEQEYQNESPEMLSLKANHLNNDEVQSAHSDNNTDDDGNTNEMWEDTNNQKDNHKDIINNNNSGIPRKVTKMSNVECTRLRNTITCKLLDLYDEIEELYSSRNNMTRQMTHAMCLDPRWTRSVAGIMQLATQPSEEQQMALSTINKNLELLYLAATELVATYLTPEEKRYLGLNSHHFQTQHERKSSYQYTSAKLLQKPSTSTVIVPTTTKDKTMKPLGSVKSSTPIARANMTHNKPVNTTINVKPMPPSSVNTLLNKSKSIGSNNKNNNTRNKWTENKPHVETTKGLMHLTPVKTNAEVKSVNFDMSHVNGMTEEHEDDNNNFDNANNYNTYDNDGNIDKMEKEQQIRSNIFTIDNNYENNNNYNILGNDACKDVDVNNTNIENNNNNDIINKGGNTNTVGSYNYLKKFEEAMTSEEPRSYNKLLSAEKNNENNLVSNTENNDITAESTSLSSVKPIAILPMVTKSADNATLTTLPNKENNTLKIQNNNDNINKNTNDDQLTRNTLQSSNIEKKPSAPLADETKHHNHHSNANAHSRFQNLLIDSDSDSSIE